MNHHKGSLKLNDDVYIELVDRFGRLEVCLSVEINHQFYYLVEKETLEIIEEIYKRVIINLDDELRLQNFFRKKKFHSDHPTEQSIAYKRLEGQLAQANDYIKELTEQKSDLTEKYHEKQEKMMLKLKEMHRELKEEKKKN